MPLNKDGLEAGQPVDFSTLMRVKRQKPVEEKPKAKPIAKKETEVK